MLFKDEAEKQRRGYRDPKSFVRNDGSEVLYRQDWLERKVELFLRANGYCEYTTSGNAARCASSPDDAHHVKPRSKGRDDRLENLQALCRYHHRLLDRRRIGGRK